MEKYMEFYRAVQADQDMAERLADRAAAFAGKDEEGQLDGLLAFAEEEGFSFDREETAAFLRNLIENGPGGLSEEELSEAELEAVAGGKQGGCFLGGVSDSFSGGAFCVFIGVSRTEGGQNIAEYSPINGACFIVGVLGF